MSAYVFGFFDIHYLNNVYHLGNSFGSYLQLIEGYNPLLYKMSLTSIDYAPLIIVGQTLVDFFSFNYVVDVVLYFLNQFYRFSPAYLLYYVNQNVLDFWKNICFVTNYSFRLHAAVLSLHTDPIYEYVNYYFQSASNLSEFIFFFGIELEMQKVNSFGNKFIVYLGTHGDLGALNSDLVLPTVLYIEKDTMFLNMFGDLLNSKLAVIAPPNAKDNGVVLSTFYEKLFISGNNGLNFDYISRIMLVLSVYYNGHKNLLSKNVDDRLDYLLPSLNLNSHLQS